MTQTYSPELAKQGDPRAIAALINKSLQAKGIMIEASFVSGCLTLIAESREAPNQSFLVEFIRNGMTSLNPASVEKVIIQGKVVGKTVPVWHEEFDLKHSSNKVPAETQPRKGTLRELFTTYIGQTIGINYKSPTKYEEADLIEAEDEYIFVVGKETGLKYYFQYTVILGVTGTETAIVVGGGMFSNQKTFPLVIQVNHLIVYGGSVGISF